MSMDYVHAEADDGARKSPEPIRRRGSEIGTPMSREDDGLRAGIAKFTDEPVNERERPGLGADLTIARSRLVGLRGELLHIICHSVPVEGHWVIAILQRTPLRVPT